MINIEYTDTDIIFYGNKTQSYGANTGKPDIAAYVVLKDKDDNSVGETTTDENGDWRISVVAGSVIGKCLIQFYGSYSIEKLIESGGDWEYVEVRSASEEEINDLLDLIGDCLDEDGNLITAVLPGSNITPESSGLALTQYYMGYYDDTDGWTVFIDKDGYFLFKMDDDNFITCANVEGLKIFNINTNHFILDTDGLAINSVTERLLIGDATAYGTGEGVFIGKHAANDYRFRVGDPTTNRLQWRQDTGDLEIYDYLGQLLIKVSGSQPSGIGGATLPTIMMESNGLWVRNGIADKNISADGTWIGNYTWTGTYNGVLLDDEGLYGYQSGENIFSLDEEGLFLEGDLTLGSNNSILFSGLYGDITLTNVDVPGVFGNPDLHFVAMYGDDLIFVLAPTAVSILTGNSTMLTGDGFLRLTNTSATPPKIEFGAAAASGDTNIYRGGENKLKTDDEFHIANDGLKDTLIIGTNNTSKDQGITFGGTSGDTNLYRDDVDLLATDDNFAVAQKIYNNDIVYPKISKATGAGGENKDYIITVNVKKLDDSTPSNIKTVIHWWISEYSWEWGNNDISSFATVTLNKGYNLEPATAETSTIDTSKASAGMGIYHATPDLDGIFEIRFQTAKTSSADQLYVHFEIQGIVYTVDFALYRSLPT